MRGTARTSPSSPLTINQQLVLDAIMNDPGLSVAEIADETELTEGRVSQALRLLEDKGLVLMLGGPIDSRYVTRAS